MSAEDLEQAERQPASVRTQVADFLRRVATSEEQAAEIFEGLERAAVGLSDTAIAEATVKALWGHYERDLTQSITGWIVVRADTDKDAGGIVADALRNLADLFEAEYGNLASKRRINDFAHWVAGRAYVGWYHPLTQKKLKRWSLSRVGDPQGAEQVESLTWELVLNRAPALNTVSSNFEALVFHQANYALLTYWKQQGAMNKGAMALPLEDHDFVEQPQESTSSSRLDSRDALIELVELACSLDHKPVRTVLFLYRYLLQWRPDEIVSELSEATLNQLLFRLALELSSAGGEQIVPPTALAGLHDRLSTDEGSSGKEILGEILNRDPKKSPTEQISAWLGAFKKALLNRTLQLRDGPLHEFLGGGEKFSGGAHTGVVDRRTEE